MHELDAASNNGVEAMRDLIEKANLGTPGRHKVYILDEVHMLSKPAEATLLKTLEEPPSHVVFVLATTDPQKVSDTIRSRTQHLRFHLLPPDVLAEHVRWVADDAGLDVSADALDAAVTQGAGSARDTLSALELIANAGGALGEELTFDEFVEALIEHDAGQALTAMAALVNVGHDPRTIAEGLVKHLRNGFLCLMAPDLVQLPAEAADALAAQAAAPRRPGPRRPRSSGSARSSSSCATPPIRGCSSRSPSCSCAASARAPTTSPASPPASPSSSAPLPRHRPPPPAPVDPATGRAKLGGHAQRSSPRRRGASGSPGSPRRHGDANRQPAASGDQRRRRARICDAVWNDTVRPNLRGLARALFAPVEVVAAAGDVVTLSAPNADPPGEVRAAGRRRRAGAPRRHRARRSRCAGRRRRQRADARRRSAPPDAAERPSTDDAPRSPDESRRRSTAGRRCWSVSPRRSPAPRSSARTTERWPSAFSPPVQTLIDELGRLPGIGPRSAQRIAFHLLKIPADDVGRLAAAIRDAKEKVRFCTRCFNVTDAELCQFCTDDRRDSRVVCVVEESRDIVAVERTGEFHGRYHVLLGAMSPLEGIGPEQLKIRELLARIEPEGIEEIILCTNPNTEGEVTAMYLARQLRPLGLRVTRLASGLPVGGDLEYADELTLGRALEGRRELADGDGS